MSSNKNICSGDKTALRYVNPKWEAAVPLFSWGGLLSPLFWFVLIMGMSIALFVPDEFARDNAVVSGFAQYVHSALLRVNHYADIKSHANTTSFPHSALLSHAFMWTAIVFLFAYNTALSIAHWKYHMEWFSVVRPTLVKRKIRLGEIFLAVLFWLGGAVVFSMMPGSASVIANADLSSRLVFSILTGVFIIPTQFFASWLPLAVFLFRSTLKGKR